MDRLNITENAWATVLRTMQDPDFFTMDDQLIYDCLLEQLSPVPFCTFLKRFLYCQAGLTGDFEAVPLSEYIDILVYAFQDNCAPASFRGETVPIRQNATSWLSQKSARRNTALLLGFGLGLTVDEVNTCLMKAMRTQALVLEDPFELCCAYCYAHGYRYPKFDALWKQYEKMDADPAEAGKIKLEDIADDRALLATMCRLKDRDGAPALYARSKAVFVRLYNTARDIVADSYNDTSGMKDVYTRDKITPRDLEMIISSAIPVSDKGNLVPSAKSALGEVFEGRFFNRQRISEILADRVPADRFDILTLHFFICAAQTLSANETPRMRFERFHSEGNSLLSECGLGEIYPANPYEAFLLMCTICDAPLSSYADVWEKAYRK